MNTDDFALALSIAFLGSTLAMILILAVRRRVSRHFGASTTYALWFTLGLWFLLPLGALVTTHEAGDPDFVLWTASQEVVSDLETEANSIPAARWPSTPIASPSLSLIESSRLIWIAGAIFWLASLVLIQIRFHRALLAQAKPASPEIVSLTEVLSRSIGLKRPVEIRMIDRPGCPFVIGLLRQSIILPSSFLRDYTEDEQRLALIHELTHIKRHDQWAKCAALVFRALQWPNPVVHFAYKAFCIDQEVNCDSDVLSGQDHTTYDYAAVIA
ncbi:MAG: hypothetical protein O7G85_01190, partial [Planctomycetota bacterium]|nr:hypothetical protein [Planctomycetota bacterium]